MDNQDLQRFKYRLDECHTFPCRFTFKFIVPQAKAPEVEELLRGFEFSNRESSTGKFVSYTAEIAMATSEDVVSLYNAAANIEGLIAL